MNTRMVNTIEEVKQDLLKDTNPTQNSISEIEREIDIDIPNVKLTWRVDELIESIQLYL